MHREPQSLRGIMQKSPVRLEALPGAAASRNGKPVARVLLEINVTVRALFCHALQETPLRLVEGSGRRLASVTREAIVLDAKVLDRAAGAGHQPRPYENLVA